MEKLFIDFCRARTLKLSCLCLAAIVSSSIPSFAQNTPLLIESVEPDQSTSGPTGKYYTHHQDWSLECLRDSASSNQCQMTAFGNLSLKDSPVISVKLTGIFSSSGKRPVFYFALPLGLMLSNGAALSIDKRVLGKLAYRSCHTDGCIVPFSLNSAMRNRLKRGTKAVLTVSDLAGKKHPVTFSLLGFSKTLNEVQQLAK